MIGIKYVDGSVLYNLRDEKMEVLLIIKDGRIKVFETSTIDYRNMHVKVKSEKTALYMISKMSHEAICEILELLSPDNPFYDYVKELKETSKN